MLRMAKSPEMDGAVRFAVVDVRLVRVKRHRSDQYPPGRLLGYKNRSTFAHASVSPKAPFSLHLSLPIDHARETQSIRKLTVSLA